MHKRFLNYIEKAFPACIAPLKCYCVCMSTVFCYEWETTTTIYFILHLKYLTAKNKFNLDEQKSYSVRTKQAE